MEGRDDLATPGAVNGVGVELGPVFVEARTGGARPEVGEDLVVTARVEGATDVILTYDYGLGDDTVVAMTTLDGENFEATIPGAGEGELIRWKFWAQDGMGRVTRYPEFFDPDDSHEFFGVPVRKEVESATEVFEWFIKPVDFTRLNSFQEVRAGVYYLGEYYDNVRFSVRGQSSRFFDKKGYNLDFNKTQRFLWKVGEARVKDIDWLTNWTDKAKSRNFLAYQLLRDAGVPTHFAFSARVQKNGEFHYVADVVEDANDLYLERAGLNPEGALYKAEDMELRLDELGDHTVARQLTRKEEGRGDLDALVEGVNLVGEARKNYIFDHVDLPMTINTLAGLVVVMQTDMGAKNYYLYRDTTGSGEWAILPWDLDLTFGREFKNSGFFFNTELATEGHTEFLELGRGSVLVEALLGGDERTREMFFRRLRSLSDEYLATNYLSERLDEQLALLDSNGGAVSDALLDFQAWGTWLDGSPVPRPWDVNSPDAESMKEAVDRLRLEWLPARRSEIYGAVADLPEEQVGVALEIGEVDYFPVSGNQQEEFFELRNTSDVSVDASGWVVSGGVSFVIPAGTVVLPGSSVFVVRDKLAFRGRLVSPKGGEQRLVVGPFSGGLSVAGETIDLYDSGGGLVDSYTYAGTSGGFEGNGREDLDGDGLDALMEWAMGSSDLEFGSLEAPVAGEFVFRQRQDLTGYVMRVETSVDLLNWSGFGVSELGRVDLGSGVEEVRVSLPGGKAEQYVRVVLER